MGKFEKKKQNDFEDIRNVFAKRDQGRAEPTPQDYPEVPEFMNEPRRIRGDAGYSVDSMREVHEGRAVYDDSPEAPVYGQPLYQSSAARPRQPEPYGQPVYGQPVYGQPGSGQPVYGQQPPPQQPYGQSAPRSPRRGRKHRFLRGLLKLLALLLALVILAGAASALLSRMPESSAPIGPRRDGCCTVLLCGTDEEGARTDTMVLLYLDRNAGTMRLLSLPRDTMVNRTDPVPKLNGAYWANGGSSGDREKGMGVLMDYVKDLVGYRPDGYMLIDLNCFEDLVDIMGGVRFDVPMDMEYNDPTQDLYIDLKQGTQQLNGREAMWLVRFRSGYAMADLDRIQVQRDFLQAAVSQWKSLLRLPRAPFALGLLMKNTETDLSYRNLCWVALALARCAGNVESNTLPGEPAWVNGGAYYVQHRQESAELVNEKYNPYETEIRPEDLHPYGY